ncbi:TrlF family AAA-like ATPase [Guptibacillus hwajinpoensis]|uniref:TrlF family AAA-like ATPase n=1 Tax=Guptibacillus hwajinpoensis TaxID=208199 RepID=UPI001CFD0F4C|nr:hypothetical protein [Pseudalkalibacillus hwajinpoensis]WLR60163.1 hypothetical protein LC071_01865 [Pseudalkalibacillus hwajinpoensis]
MNFKGARWYKTDLHIHTPASECFRDRDFVSAEQWVNKCLEERLDVVAVTDHNTGEWIDEIKLAAQGTNLTVFPGVEVTCSESKVHMIILFDTDKTRQDIEDFLIKINIPRSEFATADANSNLTTIQIVEEACAIGAVAIPAHIDEYNGLSEISFNNRESLLENENVNAVQVVHEMFITEKTEIPKKEMEEKLFEHYRKEISEQVYKDWKVAAKQAVDKKKAILTFSDNPHEQGDSKHGLWGIGKRYTWIKMNEEVSIESLKQALFLPEHRVKNDFETKGTPFTLPNSWFEKVTVSNTILNKDEIEVDFNPQMTTIIGGRGSGKSSILRFIRGVFNKLEDLDLADSIGGSNLRKEQEEFFKVHNNSTGILKKDSIIELLLNKYGVSYKVKGTNFSNGEPKEIELYKKNPETDIYELQDVKDLNDFFKFDIYSQKQIYEIASFPNSLRDRIDSSIPKMEFLKTELEKKKNEYIEQSARIRSLNFHISKKSKVKSDIQDKKEQIQSFRESGFENLIQDYKTFTKENEEIMNFSNSLRDKQRELAELRHNFNINEVKTDDFNKEYTSEIYGIMEKISNEFEIVKSLLQDAETKITNISLDFGKEIKESNWYKDKVVNEHKFKETKNELSEKGIDDLDKLESSSNELIKLEKDLKKIEEYEKDLSFQYTIRDKIYTRFLEIRNEITETRNEFLNQILNDENIRIDINKLRDRNHYIKKFREIIQKDTGYNDDMIKVGDKCLHGKSVIDNQQKIIEELMEIRNNESSDYGGRFENVIKELNEEQLDELKLHFPEDEITVKYKPNNSSSFQSLSNASAGQKTSAILTFLLSHGNVPLLLDQPEDDLDNHLIYELIVDRLKIVKSNRQIIIVTHNANIPVNGDTEWLVAMDSRSKDINVLCNGTIEENVIRSEICDVMEGGESAFKLRAKRYNL